MASVNPLPGGFERHRKMAGDGRRFASGRPISGIYVPPIVETCANCGRAIGALETPYLWNENTVCKRCYAILNEPEPVPLGSDESTDEPPQSTLSQIAQLTTAHQEPLDRPRRSSPAPSLQRGGIICPNPNCGFRGMPKKIRRGSYITAILLIFGLPPVLFLLLGPLFSLAAFILGILYLVLGIRNEYLCPRCKIKLRSERA